MFDRKSNKPAAKEDPLADVFGRKSPKSMLGEQSADSHRRGSNGEGRKGSLRENQSGRKTPTGVDASRKTPTLDEEKQRKTQNSSFDDMFGEKRKPVPPRKGSYIASLLADENEDEEARPAPVKRTSYLDSLLDEVCSLVVASLHVLPHMSIHYSGCLNIL